MAEPDETTTHRTTLALTDPRAIRAIAHEARQLVIDELYSGSVLTATEAAKICGLSPSAMSYHLRALEKWGIVVRDDDAPLLQRTQVVAHSGGREAADPGGFGRREHRAAVQLV